MESPLLTWLDIGPNNPFNKRILDIRSFTQSMMATTSDRRIARTFNELRETDGEAYIHQQVPNGEIMTTSLNYTYHPNSCEGILFKSNTMDSKWHIYAYSPYLYFVRSWTAHLVYKARFLLHSQQLTISEIEYSPTLTTIEALNNIHFLMQSHVLRHHFPHRVPQELANKQEIALWSFAQYGKKACYATYEEVVDIR